MVDKNRIQSFEGTKLTETEVKEVKEWLKKPVYVSTPSNWKLTEDNIREIRRLAQKGFKTKYLATKFKVSPDQIRRIKRRARWGWVK